MEENKMNSGHVAAPAAAIPPNLESDLSLTDKINTPPPKLVPKPLAAALPDPPSASASIESSTPAMYITSNTQVNTKNKPESLNCGYKNGDLPSCAPLAAAFVPYQHKNSPKYSHGDALTHGTLFPGLDLPFMNVANKNNPYAGTPLGDLMAIDFALHELSLYLDTHKDDKEAFEVLKSLLALNREGRKEYVKLYGPIEHSDMEKADHYSWLADPWPWEYSERLGRK